MHAIPPAKLTRLAIGKINHFGICNRQQPRHIREVVAVSKFAFGRIDRIQIVHCQISIDEVQLGGHLLDLFYRY